MDKKVPVFESKPLAAGDMATTRVEAHKAGVAARPGEHRIQSDAINSGVRLPHKFAHAQAGGRGSTNNQSAQNDARARRNLSKRSKPLADLGK